MVHPSSFRGAARWLAAVAFVLSSALPAAAAHKARLSADLVEHLAAGSQGIDVIVHGTRAEVEALVRRYNLRVKRQLRSGAVLRLNAGQLAALQEDESQAHLSSDVRIYSTADVTAETIGADQIWTGVGTLRPRSGSGIGVAVIDSGIDPNHAALVRRVTATVDFTGGDGVDRFGHGTHVAAIIAGQAGLTADTAEYQGIASGAHIVNLRVLGDDGSGYASSVIEAIDWAIEHRKAHNIRIINLSLGAPVLQPYRDDPLCEAVERAVAAGIVVVAAAGNYGLTADGRRMFGGITSPANDPSVITVGALDTKGTAIRSDDTVASFSSKGPTMYDLVLKPDLVAPGSRVVSAEAAGSYLAATYPARHVAGSGSDGYIELSGTSMSAGVVSGTAALLLEQRPNLDPGDMKAVLQVSSSLLPGEGLVASGAGSVNALAAAQVVDRRADTLGAIANEEYQINGPFTSVTSGDSTVTVQWSSRQVDNHKRRARTASGPIVWGNSDDSIVWGNSYDSDSIVWGNFIDVDSIVWGNVADDSIVWGNAAETDSIVWGNFDGDSIVWGNSSEDSIVWGNAVSRLIQ